MDVPLLDLLLIPVAYSYIFLIIAIATYLRRKERISGMIARKFVHLGIGLIIILAPLLFTNRLVPTMIGISFIFITFFTSPISPLPRLRLSAFKDGHGFGTVYYSITLTLLLYFFLDQGWIIQAGFLPLVFGDAFANIFGVKYGKTKWKLIPNKTVEGSLAAFVSTAFILFVVLSFYKLIGHFPIVWYLILIIVIVEGLAMTFIELVSPYGLDNLTIPIICSSLAIWIVSFSSDIIIYFD